MNLRTLTIGVALGLALISWGTPLTSAGSPANCTGQHVSMLARAHGGMAPATAHHAAIHETELTVGEHEAHIREMCATATR